MFSALAWSCLVAVLLLAAEPGAQAKIYQKCELARELKNKYGFPVSQIPTWVCIAYYESRYNTEAIGRLNTDSSTDYGLFQINNRYWCDNGSRGCGVACQTLLHDMNAMVKCTRMVYEETKRMRGNGFTAWTTYNQHCLHAAGFTADCHLCEAEYNRSQKLRHLLPEVRRLAL